MLRNSSALNLRESSMWVRPGRLSTLFPGLSYLCEILNSYIPLAIFEESEAILNLKNNSTK